MRLPAEINLFSGTQIANCMRAGGGIRSLVGRFTKYGNDCECILLYGTQGGEAEGRNNDRENFFQGMSNFVKRNKWK